MRIHVNLQGNQQLEFARNGISKEWGGVEFARNAYAYTI